VLRRYQKALHNRRIDCSTRGNSAGGSSQPNFINNVDATSCCFFRERSESISLFSQRCSRTISIILLRAACYVRTINCLPMLMCNKNHPRLRRTCSIYSHLPNEKLYIVVAHDPITYLFISNTCSSEISLIMPNKTIYKEKRSQLSNAAPG
jgi:hypothetical protein